MEEFILNRPFARHGLAGSLHPPEPDLAWSCPLAPRPGPAERRPDCYPFRRGTVSVEHSQSTPHFRLHPPGPSTAGRPVFLTWRLRESVPHDRLVHSASQSPWEEFAWLDRFLDEARTGPLYFRHGEVAGMVVETFRAYGPALQQYELHSFVVMPNHVHLLLTPRIELAKLTAFVKGAIARRANELLNQPDTPFWDEENCEHLVGDTHELGRIRQYIELNPVPVGMAREPADYVYSSAAR